MKKKFYAILLTSLFLVSVITASAFAASTLIKVDEGETSKGTMTDEDSSPKSVTIEGVKQFETKTYVLYIRRKDGTESTNRSVSVTGSLKQTSLSEWTKQTGDEFYDKATLVVEATGSGTGEISVSGTAVWVENEKTNTKAVELKLAFDVTAADKPVWDADSLALDGEDMAGAGYWGDADGTFYPGQDITTALAAKKFVATTTNDPASTSWKMTGTFTPEMPKTGDKLEFTPTKGTDDNKDTITGVISGKIPSVTKKTEYTLTITAEDAAGKATETDGETEKSITVKFTVSPATAVAASNSAAVTWGQPFTLTPTISAGGVNSTGGWAISAKEVDGTTDIDINKGYLTADDFADDNTRTGLVLDANTGVISGTWTPTTGSADNAVGKTWSGTDIVKKVVLQATNGKNDDASKNSIGRKEITLTFKGVAPTITKTASEVTSAFNALNSNKGVLYPTALPAKTDDTAIKVTASGPGKISWTVEPATGKLDDYGLVITDQDDATSTAPATLTITGTPTTTVKNLKLKITATNAKGKSAVIEPTLTIGAVSVSLLQGTDEDVGQAAADVAYIGFDGSSAKKIVGKSTFTTVYLYAKPGPVKWTTKNLPTGITLTPDTKDSTKAVLKGSFTAPRASEEDDDTEFEIKAVNTNYTNLEAKIDGKLMVWALPEITTASLFKKNVIDTGTEYDVEITASNTPQKDKWKITASTTSGGSVTLVKDGEIPATNNEFKPTTSVTGFTPASVIKVDATEFAKTGDNFKLVLTGSLDCVPKNGEKIKFTITAGNEAGTNPKEFEVTVKGKAPTLKKEDLTLSGSEAKTIKVTGGDGPITMKAYVDDKTAKKLFGVDDAIDLTTANVTGLIFGGNTDYKGESATIAFSDTSKVPDRYSKKMAYSKLPVTIEASNSDVSTKAASAKYTVTKTASAKPSWTSVHNLSATYKNADLTADATLKTANELLIEAGTPLPAADSVTVGSEGILFKAAGDGPWEVTVKPETKNGLTAAYTESTGEVAITGKVDSGKKDVTTKFTLTLKNPSTGETAKSDITIVAKQKPAVDKTTIETSVLYGKKVKLAPKVTASSNGMKWLIRSITDAVGTYTDTTDNTDAKTELKELHGLDFDENKGAISGTPNHATGKATPIEIKMVASTDLAIYGGDDEVTAKITVLGEKAKLTTKKVTLPIDATDFSDKIIETNLKGYDTTRANVTFEGNFSDFDAVKGMGLTAGTDNTATFSGTPSAVTKKASVTVKMKNYDTETTGKLAITVEGAKPEIAAVSAIDATAGSTPATATVTLSNQTQVSEKIKWKISKKPDVSGVSAKIKGDANSATITVKVNKKVADDTTATFSITATDSLSKKTSDPVEVTVNVSNPTDTEAAPLEANDVAATPEAKTDTKAEADEKVLGEGEVHMGAERTADKLTAQQRKFFEDEGYVIAAVLPEIEVTAAGQYDFEVDLDKEVETGAELVWFAFASKPTTDDEIVDFADEKGKETKVVPESHVVTVAPWLNAETKYAPVIAVKAAAKDADATTVEGVKEAAEAKTEE